MDEIEQMALTTEDAPGQISGLVADQEGAAELAAANDFIAYERTHFGQVDKLTFPFSEQLKVDIRRRFDIDKEIYGKSDETERSVMVRTAKFRLLTFVLMLVFVLWAAAVYRQVFTANDYQNVDTNSFAGIGLNVAKILSSSILHYTPSLFQAALFGLLSAGLALIVIRNLIRMIALGRINRSGEQFAHMVSTRHDHISLEIQEACNRSYSRAGTEKRVDRARRWPKIAAWNARRGEALDRYTTTVLWRVQIYFMAVEAAFLSLKGIVLIGIVAWMLGDLDQWHFFAATSNDGLFRLMFLVIFVCLSVLGWGPFWREKNSVWTNTFTNEFGPPDNKRPHFFNAICEVVENCVKGEMANQRTQPE